MTAQPRPKRTPSLEVPRDGVRFAEQLIYRFANGRGASVVRGSGSYGGDAGLWELAVLQLNGAGWSLDYTTPITSDVEGSLTADDVDTLLDRIEALPSAEAAQ